MMRKLLCTSFIIFVLFVKAFADFETVKISSVGDVIPHMGLQHYAAKQGGFDVLFDRFKGALKNSDISFANFEATINPFRKISGYPAFNTRPDLMKALKNAGFNALSLANNHSLDTGSYGLYYTKHHADKLNFISSGISLNAHDMFKPLYFKIKGITFSYISMTTITNMNRNPRGYNTPKVFVYNRRNKRRAINALKQARAKSDFVIVSLHFGREYHDSPGKYQKNLARFLIKMGANLILGNHPHHIQRPEIYYTGGRKNLISYSQGNFISHQNRHVTPANPYHHAAKRGDSYILNVYVKKSGSRPEIVRVTYTPLWTLCFRQDSYLGFKSVVLRKEIENPLFENQRVLLEKRRERIIDFMKGFEIEE